MSQTIDTKVVELQFDNSKFEKNIETSLNSLKNLNKSVEDAGKNRNSLDGLAKAGDHLGVSFDNMNMKSRISLNMMDMLAGVGTKAFNRISDAVAGFALNMANSLSGMQAMRDGFNEYELKMGSVQTILTGAKIIDPSTGKALEDEAKRLDVVNKKLNDLNTYSDKTIYSFKDMTSNIGKFTNAGIELDDAVAAIQGVANVAAVSGANAGEASRAMYNFSQALSSGYVKLIDWKSIENANMATMDFKQQLLDTAVALGTVTKKGNDYVSTTTDANGKVSEAFNATKMFNDSLSHQWMTSEVLTQTLKNYSTDVNEMSKAEVAAYKEKLKSIGYTEEQAEGIVKLSKKAFAAATEVKTFSQMIDTLKESLGSGWAQSFEIIFGNFREAKALWTGVNNAVDAVFSKIADTRNAILQTWKDDGGRTALIKSFSNLYQAVKNLLAPVYELWKALTPNTNNTGKLLASISKGFEKLTAVVAKAAGVIGKVLSVLFKPIIFLGNLAGKVLIRLVGVVKSAFSKISGFFRSIGNTVKGFADTVANAFDKHITSRIKAFQKTLANALNSIKRHIKNSSALQKLIQAFNELKEVVKELFGKVLNTAGIFIGKFVDSLGLIWNAIKPLMSSAITKAIRTISDFVLPRLESALTWVANRLRDFGKLLGKIDIKNSRFYRGLSELPNRFKDLSKNKTLTGIFTKIKDFGSDALIFVIDKFKALKLNLEAIKMPRGLSDVFANIKNFIKSIFGEDSINDKINETSKALSGVGEKDSGKKLTGFQSFLDGISKAFGWVKTAATLARDAIASFINFIIENTPKAFHAMYNLLAGDDGIITLSEIADVIWTVSDAFSELLASIGIEKVGTAVQNFSEAFGELTVAATTLVKRVSNRLQMAAIKDFALAIGILAGSLWLLAQLPASKLIGAAAAIGVLGGMLVKFFGVLSTGTAEVNKIVGNVSIALILVSIGAAMLGVAASVGILVGALAIFPKVIKQYNNLGNEFRTGMERVKDVLAEIFNYLDHSVTSKYSLRNSIALLGLVKALSMMRKTIVKFAGQDTGDAMADGLKRIKKVMEVLSEFLNSASIASFNGVNIGVNFNSLGIAAMIFALGDMISKIVGPIRKLAQLTPAEFDQAFGALDKIFNSFESFMVTSGAMTIFSSLSGGGLRQWLGVAANVAILASAIGSIVSSIKTMTELVAIDAGTFWTAFNALTMIFVELGALLTIIGLMKPSVAVGTLFGLTLAIGVLTACVVALVPLAATKPQALLGSVLALGGLMLALGGALFLIGQASKKAKITDILMMVGVVGAMLILTSAIRRIARIGDPNSIVAAGEAIGIAALAMAGAIAIINAVSVNGVVIGVLALLAVAIWGVAAAIWAFKSSAGGMAEGAKQVEAGANQMGDAMTKSTENVASSLRDMLPQMFGDLFANIGPRIQEALKNFKLGEFIRARIEEVKADAANWAQDMIDIGTNLINGLSEAISNPSNVEKVRQCMINLGKALVESFKLFLGIASPSTVMIEQGGYIIDGLVQGLMDFPGKLAEWVSAIGNYIIEGISSLVTGAIEKGKALGQSIGEGLQNGKDFVVEKASALGKAALEKLGKAQDWAKKAGSSVSAFGERLRASKNPIARAAGNMISGATTAVSTVAKVFRSSASTAASTFHAQLRSGVGPARAAGSALVAGAKAAFKGIGDSFRTFGKNAAEGFRNGIHNMISSIAEKARELVRRAKEAAKSEQRSNSPSKDFMEYGGWAAQGYALGLVNKKSSRLIANNAKKMVSTAKGIASSVSFGANPLSLDSNPAINSLALAMGQISDTLDSNINSTPTIKPVIDMSDINRNAPILDALFSDRQVDAGISATRFAQDDFNRTMANRADLMSMSSISKLANKIESMTESMNSRALNNYITIDGASDPEAFADGLISSFRLNARTV